LLVFVQLALKPGFHQQHLLVLIFSPLLVFVQLAWKPGFHQQHLQDVQFYRYHFSSCWWCHRCLPSTRTPTTAVSGLRAFSPLLVFVQLALKPGFHQQHLLDVQFYRYHFSSCWWCHRCLPSTRTPTTAVSGLRAFSPLLVFVQLAWKPGFHQQHLQDVQFYRYHFSSCWWCHRCLPSTRTPTTAVSGLRAFSPLLVFVQLALKPGFHQQHLLVFIFSPLLVFVQLAWKPGFHQQHLQDVQFYRYAVVGVRAVGLEASLSPTTLTGCTILSLPLF